MIYFGLTVVGLKGVSIRFLYSGPSRKRDITEETMIKWAKTPNQFTEGRISLQRKWDEDSMAGDGRGI
jgi:hypothetical protein